MPTSGNAVCHLLRATVPLVTGKSLLLGTVWTAAVRLWQDYISKRVGGGMEGQEWWLLLDCSPPLFLSPNSLSTVFLFRLICLLIFHPFRLPFLQSLLLSSFFQVISWTCLMSRFESLEIKIIWSNAQICQNHGICVEDDSCILTTTTFITTRLGLQADAHLVKGVHW